MLSFPTPSWQKARAAPLKSPTTDFPGLKYGRAASLILPRLYLSDFFTARDEEEMEKLGITHMVSVMEAMPTKMPEMIRHHVPIQDRWTVDILQHLDGTTEFIREALAEDPANKVLVHCFQGVSRSATVVCAYVIATSANGMTAGEAIGIVKAKRGIVNPNEGFRAQLARYAERHVGNGSRGPKGVAAASRTRTTTRIGDGIAARIRRFKAGAAATSSTSIPPKRVEVEETP
ncbi:phosphatases II [Athelia psychrophila]|uniref:Phosphatases II n=1 Tax=Athelia psychrophila TaxID=1759441 RepID=A0A166JNU1_9AGAM|nr:phosphatases II [Fibularhizoctonia sp. CBS 109695]